MKKLLSVAAMLLMISVLLLAAPPRPVAQTQPVDQTQIAKAPYVPQAWFCANGSGTLCSLLPAYIGPDPRLTPVNGYPGLYGPPPTQASGDVQTPFDNMAWQMFVALNWAADAVKQPAAIGLTKPGPRVWQTYRKVSALFGNSPVRAGCTQALALPKFYIGSDGKGNPAPNNEEYLQASTNLPLIDIHGNWTVFERRVNDIEANYLLAPNGQASQTLTTMQGQSNFIANNPGGVQFTASATVPDGANGSIEIKAAWRIIDRARGDDPTRYLTQLVFLAVPGDLVRGGRQFCRSVTVGLVGLHILQRNPDYQPNGSLLPQWIWASFEHVDNAPMAQLPCSVRNGCGNDPKTDWINQATCGLAAPSPKAHYSFFRANLPIRGTNISPASPGTGNTQFPWNSRQPYADGGTTGATQRPQAVRCWSIYPTTEQLNAQWRMALGSLKSVLQNYMLIGTQWGGNVEPEHGNPVPANAVPGMLSNITLETYIQNYTGSVSTLPGPGSCVSCHSGAPLPANGGTTSANFSFLPLLADPSTARSRIKTAR